MLIKATNQLKPPSFDSSGGRRVITKAVVVELKYWIVRLSSLDQVVCAYPNGNPAKIFLNSISGVAWVGENRKADK